MGCGCNHNHNHNHKHSCGIYKDCHCNHNHECKTENICTEDTNVCLTRKNMLSEFRSDIEKAEARKNLGITESFINQLVNGGFSDNDGNIIAGPSNIINMIVDSVAPNNPQKDTLWFNTVTKEIFYYDGNEWIQSNKNLDDNTIIVTPDGDLYYVTNDDVLKIVNSALSVYDEDLFVNGIVNLNYNITEDDSYFQDLPDGSYIIYDNGYHGFRVYSDKVFKKIDGSLVELTGDEKPNNLYIITPYDRQYLYKDGVAYDIKSGLATLKYLEDSTVYHIDGDEYITVSQQMRLMRDGYTRRMIVELGFNKNQLDADIQALIDKAIEEYVPDTSELLEKIEEVENKIPTNIITDIQSQTLDITKDGSVYNIEDRNKEIASRDFKITNSDNTTTINRKPICIIDQNNFDQYFAISSKQIPSYEIQNEQDEWITVSIEYGINDDSDKCYMTQQYSDGSIDRRELREFDNHDLHADIKQGYSFVWRSEGQDAYREAQDYFSDNPGTPGLIFPVKHPDGHYYAHILNEEGRFSSNTVSPDGDDMLRNSVIRVYKRTNGYPTLYIFNDDATDYIVVDGFVHNNYEFRYSNDYDVYYISNGLLDDKFGKHISSYITRMVPADGNPVNDTRITLIGDARIGSTYTGINNEEYDKTFYTEDFSLMRYNYYSLKDGNIPFNNGSSLAHTGITFLLFKKQWYTI